MYLTDRNARLDKLKGGVVFFFSFNVMKILLNSRKNWDFVVNVFLVYSIWVTMSQTERWKRSNSGIRSKLAFFFLIILIEQDEERRI